MFSRQFVSYIVTFDIIYSLVSVLHQRVHRVIESSGFDSKILTLNAVLFTMLVAYFSI